MAYIIVLFMKSCCSVVPDVVTPWTATLSSTSFWILSQFMMPRWHEPPVLCHPLFLLPTIFPRMCIKIVVNISIKMVRFLYSHLPIVVIIIMPALFSQMNWLLNSYYRCKSEIHLYLNFSFVMPSKKKKKQFKGSRMGLKCLKRGQ